MLIRRRLIVSFAAAALLVGVAAPRAGADDGDKKESRSVWDRAVDAGKATVDKVWPGDTVQEKVASVATGRSLLSPFPNWGNVAKAPVQVQHLAAEQVGKALIPGYDQASELGDDIDGAVKDRVPGGWRTVGVAGLVLVVLILWKLLVPPAVSAGKTAVRSHVPIPAGGTKPRPARAPRPAPTRRTQTRHAPSAAAKATWAHSGQHGKADVISADRTRLVLCADDEDAAMVAARKRFQGYRVRSVLCVPCDVTPDKVHAHVKKDSTTKARRS